MSTTALAHFAGGCFWCTEAVFKELRGVQRVSSGYAGGRTSHPTYEQVCSGGTGHAEVIRIEFDPKVISFRDLLTVFFATHDPTTLNRQGNDVGTQYRSAIFHHTAEQERVAREVIGELDDVFHDALLRELIGAGHLRHAVSALVDAHDDIVLKHDEEHRWCLDCHDATNRDVLHLASGEPVPFAESYRLCGQCHGEKYRDWRVGVHGRRVGQWNGAKQYLLCVHCHNPHQPRYKPMAPKPAPLRPMMMDGL